MAKKCETCKHYEDDGKVCMWDLYVVERTIEQPGQSAPKTKLKYGPRNTKPDWRCHNYSGR